MNVAICLQNPQSFYSSLPTKSSIQEIFSNSSYTLIGISGLLGDKDNLAIRALLNVMVTDLVDFFNVGKSMTKVQVVQTVELIVDDYAHLKPEDFKKCFTNAKKGQYGPVYDRVDGQLILSWLMVYDNERDCEIEDLRAKQNRLIKFKNDAPLLPARNNEEAWNNDVFTRNLKKLQDDRKARQAAREVTIKPKEVVKDPVNVMVQGWHRQFDALWKRQGYHKNRFVEKYGRMLDANEYLDHKQWQYEQAIKRQNQ